MEPVTWNSENQTVFSNFKKVTISDWFGYLDNLEAVIQRCSVKKVF